MVLGLGKSSKKKQAKEQQPLVAAAGPSSPSYPQVGDRNSSRPAVGGGSNGVPSAPSSFKYGNSVSKSIVDLAGLPVNVFGLSELTPAPSRASAPPPPPVCVVIHLHGRGGTADNEEKIARQLYDRIARDKDRYRAQQEEGMVATSSIQRDHIVVTFDARNHGHRTTNPEGQKAWKQGNTQHAMDLYGMIVGGARDASFVVDFLSSYLFPHDERTVAEWVANDLAVGHRGASMIFAKVHSRRACRPSRYQIRLEPRWRHRPMQARCLEIHFSILAQQLASHKTVSPTSILSFSQLPKSSKMGKQIDANELKNHKSADSAWVAVDGKVYDVTEFLDDHPGGKKILLKNCGKDATEAFWTYHGEKVLEKVGKDLEIGESRTRLSSRRFCMRIRS
ncbi:hypothetical protein L1887_59329 [Cichorium endivia]|nr:hypothetical protein L1887_59329 [Cichorium endivia]